MENHYDNLTLEQQFTQANFKNLVSKMSIEQAKAFLVELHRSMIIRDNYYQSMLKKMWFSDL